ncbi:MAG: TAXI family TRAP transporter solute-binding subunit [Desulfuromonadales bacterium]|nr:MAG: TAXI family TRAP transporter solute-binding subunit [Desulfuromonadales bacterium]
MRCRSRLVQTTLTLFSAAIVLLAPATVPAFTQPSLSISAGNVTGANYAASSAIAKIFNRKSAEYGVRLSTVATEGALATIDNVVQGKTAFGIAQADRLQRAAKGVGPWAGKAQTGLRAVLALQMETLTVVAASDREIGKIGDLKGKRVNIGAPGSSDNEYGAILLERYEVKPADVTLSEHPTALAAEFLQKDDIDAYIYTVSHPNLSILEASTGKRKVVLVPLDKKFIEQVVDSNPLLLPAEIPTAFYPGLERQGVVPTIGVRAVLFTRNDMPEETVYRLVRDVMTNFDLFKRQHPALQGLTPREASAAATVIPLHPGAERYFREAGLAP